MKNLSNDKKAREQLVTLADTWVKSGLPAKDTTLMEIRTRLDADISSANTVLGLGGWLPDHVRVTFDPVTREKTYAPRLDSRSLSVSHQKISNGTILFTFGQKMGYLLRLAYQHFFGFLITAIAISLGAPFWFDLLNRIMKLRTSVKQK